MGDNEEKFDAILISIARQHEGGIEEVRRRVALSIANDCLAARHVFRLPSTKTRFLRGRRKRKSGKGAFCR